jgi:hypothetical protein
MSNVGEKFGLTRDPQFNIVRHASNELTLTRTSIFTGARNTMTLPITMEEFRFWRSGQALIQEVFPHLNPIQREFLMSGETEDEWTEIFGSAEDEEAES